MQTTQRKNILLKYTAIVFLFVLSQHTHASEFGKYLDDLIIKVLDDGRTVEVIGSYEYEDPNGKTWTVPDRYVVNGASIPQFLWSVVGGPYSGRYRNASVVHDYYCDVKSESWKDVHRMFYFAMRANNVSATRAKLMYSAVYRFGPRWNFEYVPNCEDCLSIPMSVTEYQSPLNEEDFSDLQEAIESNEDISLESLESIAEAQFISEISAKDIGTPNLGLEQK